MNIPIWSLSIYFSNLLIISIIDIRDRSIPTALLLLNLTLGILIGTNLFGFICSILGSLIGCICFLILKYLGKYFENLIKIHHCQPVEVPSLGNADVLMAIIIGALLGKDYVILGLITPLKLAALFCIFHLIYRISKREYHPLETIPLIPFMAIGSTIILLYVCISK